MTEAEQIVETLLGEDIDTRLADICMRKLTEMGLADKAKLLRYCNDLKELHSFLRERVFFNDAKTFDFVRKCQAELTGRQSALPA